MKQLKRLSEKEVEALRLLGHGHDAKSIASVLGVSVHSVNERLRTARRKLGVSSSREAARLLLAHEACRADDNLGHKKIVIAAGDTGDSYRVPAHRRATGAERRATFVSIGALMLTVLVSLLVATQPSHGARAAEPIYPIPSLFAVPDYPAEALARNQQGITDYSVVVNSSGRVEKCSVERSSGSAALDQATCRVISRRARFRPAVDKAGRPVPWTYTGMIHWRL